jgi:inner membrane protein
MDPFTHSLVGLTSAKAGLGRLSPFATTVCIVAANAPDSDVVVAFTTDRWNYLHYHRGLTHSIVGCLVLAILIPSIVYVADRIIAAMRKRQPQIRYRGLLLASLIATATHPLMDWTNNYGVRPFLPWSGKWFYGDFVFIVDPYLLLLAGGAAFLATSDRWPKIILWAAVAAVFVVLSFIVQSRPDPAQMSPNAARTILLSGVLLLFVIRVFGISRGREKAIALGALAAIVLYLSGLAVAHRAAYRDAALVSTRVAGHLNESFIRVAAMPTLANPFRWTCVAETDRAIYRFNVKLGAQNAADPPQLVVDGFETDSPAGIERFEKPNDRAAEIVAVASRDRRAQILLGFARFPLARVPDENCVSQTLVQFADLRYTEPGASRGLFSLNVPVDCPTR